MKKAILTNARAQFSIERTYAATMDEVWNLWTTKAGIESWWGPEGFDVTVPSINLKSGGELVYLMTATLRDGAPSAAGNRWKGCKEEELDSLPRSQAGDGPEGSWKWVQGETRQVSPCRRFCGAQSKRRAAGSPPLSLLPLGSFLRDLGGWLHRLLRFVFRGELLLQLEGDGIGVHLVHGSGLVEYLSRVMPGGRYLIRCQIVSRMDLSQVRAICEAAMREYGMPARIRTDNGAPFAGTGLLGLSKLSLGWMKLGIVHERIQAGLKMRLPA